MEKDQSASAIVFFDGVCHLCQGAVKFIIRRDPRGRFRFASLQSSSARKLLADRAPDTGDTMLLLEKGRIYSRSAAALRIAKGLRFPWPLLYIFIMVPPAVRNAVYRWIAANRYKWFGKAEACMVPTPDIKRRFLEDEN
ncbi:thiol-disulfide oxidoreductase DCC family protein [Paenibacillus faecis]|uniref:thiol-disulfide oxidoreductase DCC family protein n=1 Tax=Paenibacillus faecis TaxID=862114 RepID=UPI001BD0C548|nr:DCC1-like thiol-disulfide oxidoreductase family protein [Paenibacillus faecis]